MNINPHHTTQRQLFESEPFWCSEQTSFGVVATVVVSEGVEKPLDYIIPERLLDAVEPGRRVRVPLGRGNREVLAYCVAVSARELPQKPLKEILAVEDEHPLLTPKMLELTEWMSGRWMCRWGEVLEAVLPAGVRLGTRSRETLHVIRDNASQTPSRAPSASQARVLALANIPHTIEELTTQANVSRAVVTRLLKTKQLMTCEGSVQSASLRGVRHDRPERLSDSQQQALNTIVHSMHSGRSNTIVLFGVTGSGKTEVYLQAVEQTLSFGRQAIVLVPEISLTPQTCDRFRARFGNVAVLHSHLTAKERHSQWRQIAAGKASVVIGARSAVFAPTPHLGLIVIDEEHESSFKQSTAPRYHARDVAAYRAGAEGIPLVLGSATPSLETFSKCLSQEWIMVELPQRVAGARLPSVLTVDQRIRSDYSCGAISGRLKAAIDWALGDDGQVILLLNRRGFATHVQCRSCGYVARCPQCDVTLTHHQPGNRGICHGCGLVLRLPDVCPSCSTARLGLHGTGTQRLEEQIRSFWPGAQVARMDADTMRTRGSHERTLDAFRDGAIDILVGTQMIAKGLDFPGVRVVGVVQADAALHLADFRAAERTCQLVTQVAGRCGRGIVEGRVVVQTMSPDHPALKAAAAHNYKAFVEHELPLRKALGYPPYGALVRIVVRSIDSRAAEIWATSLADSIRQELTTLSLPAGLEASSAPRVLGPAPAPIARLRERWRWHFQVHGPDGEQLRAALARVFLRTTVPDNVAWMVDVDPVEML